MPEYNHAAMTEATRLTRQGRLAEAVTLLQQTLAGTTASTAPTSGEILDSGARPAAGHVAPAGHTRTGDGPRVMPFLPGRDGGAGLAGAATGSGLLSRLTTALTTALPARLTGRTGPTRLLLPDLPSRLRRPATPQHSTAEQPPGQFLDHLYTNDAGTRAYKLYVPTGYTGQNVPLVVMLHGCTQDAADFADGTGMNHLAERQTLLVAYPQQDSSANPLGCWNWFQPTDQRRDDGEPSLIAGITREIIARYAVDADRVYIAGFSAGAAMTAVMATTHPDLYAAAGLHSGLANGAAHDLPSAFAAMQAGGGHPAANRSIPLIIFHGDNDPTVHPVNADHLVRQATAHHQPTTATSSRQHAPGHHPSTRTTHRTPDGDTLAEHWTIHGAGHAWSGGTPHGSYTDPRGPDATTEILRFFTEHPRRRPN